VTRVALAGELAWFAPAASGPEAGTAAVGRSLG